MRLLLISPPDALAAELPALDELFGLGLVRYHVRKPGWSQSEMTAYLARIPARHHARLVLHAHPALVAELELGGLHLTAAARAALVLPPRLRPSQTLSTSFHSLAEIHRHRRRYDYVFLSPIFDSLSKVGYNAACHLPEVAAALRQLRRRTVYAPQVVALGGIGADKLAAVRELGFAGAAVLGAVWQSPDPVAAFHRLHSIVG